MSGVVRQAGVVETGREMFGAAAIALIEQYGAETRGVGLAGDARHVVRRARALEAVQQHDGGMCSAIRLPEAISRDLGIRLDLKESPLHGRQCCRWPLP